MTRINLPLYLVALTATAALSSVSTAFADSYTKQYGFQVSQVVSGMPAADQGIEVNDVIVSVNGHPVRSGNDLRLWLGKAGNSAALQVIDCNTGRVNEITVYPINGKIGIDGNQVLLTSGSSTPNDPPQTPYGSPHPAPPTGLPGR